MKQVIVLYLKRINSESNFYRKRKNDSGSVHSLCNAKPSLTNKQIHSQTWKGIFIAMGISNYIYF